MAVPGTFKIVGGGVYIYTNKQGTLERCFKVKQYRIVILAFLSFFGMCKTSCEVKVLLEKGFKEWHKTRRVK